MAILAIMDDRVRIKNALRPSPLMQGFCERLGRTVTNRFHGLILHLMKKVSPDILGRIVSVSKNNSPYLCFIGRNRRYLFGQF